MARRGENIRKRQDGRWEARIIAYYNESGKPHYKSIYGNSYAQVKGKLDEYSKSFKQNTLI